MAFGPAPSPYNLYNRLQRAEAGLRATEKARDALFKRLNVNRRRHPELDPVIEALAAIPHGLDHARGDRSSELEPPPRCPEMSMFVEDVRPEDDPFGEPTAVELSTQDAGDSEKVLRAVIPTKLPEN